MPLKPPSRHSSPSPSPSRRVPSRSPSDRRRSGSATPSLHRKASMNSLHSANGVGPSQPALRRSSSGQVLGAGTGSSPTSAIPPIQEKPPLTAAGVASDYFKAELEAHHGPVSTLPTQTVVILNDAVYGHRFSRPRTSKSALSTIVERPERIKAGVLGISLAYVRLGERHSEGAISPHPKRSVHDIPNIPFRIHKTTRRLPLMSQAVTNVHGTKWMEDLKIMCESAEAKLAMGGMGGKELQRPPRSRGSDEPGPQRLHEGDLYLCSESLNAIEGALGAVCEGIDTVFAPGPGPRRAFVGVRPPGHHCSASHPSGFCWVNNVHVGIMHAALNHGLTHAAIIDFDLHHGDGSQAIVWQHNTRAMAAAKNAAPWKKSSIGYFSLHDINSYPCESGDEEKVKNASLCIDNAHGQTVWNVHLQPWKSEQEFWSLYESKYYVLLEKTRSYLKNQAERLRSLNQAPKAAIFLSAGFDASEWESAGMQRHKVNVPTEFYARLSQDVIKIAAEEGLGVEGRVISVLEGGYSDRAICSGTFSHLSGLVGNMRQEIVPEPTGLGAEMGQQISTGSAGVKMEDELSSIYPYQPVWWAQQELEQLESLVSGPIEAPPKPRQTGSSTYASPTQASTAKVTDPIKMRRSLSGLSNLNKAMARPLSPPPPEVPWTVAAHELSKILIPSDRQTDSCKPEDLNAEATRARQARQSELGGPSPAPTPSRMALRGRKPKATLPAGDEEDLAKNRRRTVATSSASSDRVSLLQHISPSLSEPKANCSFKTTTNSSRATPEPTVQKTVRRTSRRLSGVSVATPKEELPPLPSTDRIVRHTNMNMPQTAISRPELTTAGRSQSTNNLPVKKTRVASTPRKEPAPRAPRGTKKSVSGPKPASSPGQQAASSKTTSSKAAAGASDDMDNITNGMKRIKINLMTQSKKDARERARAQGSSSAASEDRSGVQSERQTPLVSPTTADPDMTASVGSLINTPTPANAGYDSSEDAPGELAELPPLPSDVPPSKGLLGSSLAPTSPALPQVEIQPSSDPADVFIAYQPEGPTPVPAAQSEQLQWLPPNVNTPAPTPSPVKKQNNLFHYTAGSIPFAPRPQSSDQKKDTSEQGDQRPRTP